MGAYWASLRNMSHCGCRREKGKKDRWTQGGGKGLNIPCIISAGKDFGICSERVKGSD